MTTKTHQKLIDATSWLPIDG